MLLNQSRFATRLDEAVAGLWFAVGLLALVTALAAAGLTLELRQRRALLAVGRELGELDQRLEAWRRGGLAGAPPPGGVPAPAEVAAAASGSPAASVFAAPASSAGSQHRGEPEVSPPAAAPAAPASRPAEGPPEPGAAAAFQASPALPAAIYNQVAHLLAQLSMDMPRLAAGFVDSGTRERFLFELGAPLAARLERFRTYSKEGEEQLRQSWLLPDLVTTLDALARYYAAAIDEERRGHATGLAAELRAWLYDSFGLVCRTAGWFVIEPVDPYSTRFDPRLHHAVAGRDVDGAQGQVVDIKAIGRRDPASGAVAHKAEVVVGR